MASTNVADLGVVARDGVQLRGYTCGSGPGPAILLCNGLLGGIDAWRELIEDFAPLHKIVSWEYRGLRWGEYASISVQKHAEDMIDVANAAGLDRFVVVGWSVGTRVALAAAPEAGQRLAAQVLIAGLYGRPLRRVLAPYIGPLSAVGPQLTEIAAALAPYAPTIWKVAGLGARSATVHDVLRVVGAVSEMLDSGRLGELLADGATIELPRLLAFLQAVDSHTRDAPEIELDVPALLVSGSADPLSPRADVEQAAEQIGNAETMRVPSAGQLLPVEFSELLHLRIDRFFRVQLGFDRLVHERAVNQPAAR